MEKILLIDGSNLIFRAYYATEKFDMTNPEGIPINAVKTLLSMIDKIIKREKPDYLFVAMDSGKATFRHKKYSDYKGKREAAPEKLKVQFPLVYELLDAMGIKYSASEEFEADDIIATYAKNAEQKGIKAKVITGDKDLLQIINDNTNVLTPQIGFSKECDYDVATFEEKFTFKPKRIIEYKALVGDSSDNIIGVNKLGDKTAKKLLNEYQNLEEIIGAAKDGQIKGKLGENIVQSIDHIKENEYLVTLNSNADLKYEFKDLKFENYTYQEYGEYLRKYGFNKEYNNLIDQGLFDEKLNQEVDFLTFDDIEFEEIDEFTLDYIGDITSIYTQSLKPNYILSSCLGFGIVSEKGNYYLPFSKINNNFREFITGKYQKIIHNHKRLLVILKLTKIESLKLDPYLALALLDSKNYSKEMASIYSTYGIHYLKMIDKIYGSKQNPQIKDENLSKRDMVAKALATFSSYEHIQKQIEDEKLDNVLYNIEMPLSSVLAKMEINGITINMMELSKTKTIFEKENKKFLEEIDKYTNININSPSQLGILLFDEWKLPKQGLKKTKSGISTDVENIEKLLVMLKDKTECEDKNCDYTKEIDFLNLLLEYRQNSKILNTYLSNLQKFILEDHKIHPINNQLLSETGRLSVMDPSIQNMPVSGKYSKYIRNLFVPSKGCKMIAFDYSQIELRIMSVFSDDENMINAFNNNRDIHTETAKQIFNLKDVSKENRSKAKAINFGIIYGMSPYGLAKQVGISNDEAKQFIQKYFESFPGIEKYMENTIEDAEKMGFVTTLSNRIRKIKTIKSKNFREKEQAKRMAINTPIQGSAADILKMALIKVDQKLHEHYLKSRMIMQIHDEIVFEVIEDEIAEVIKIVTDVMENIVLFPIKLKVDYGIGDNWLETK